MYKHSHKSIQDLLSSSALLQLMVTQRSGSYQIFWLMLPTFGKMLPICMIVLPK